MVDTINPLPNITPKVFFTTIGNDIDTVIVGNRTGSITQIHRCPGKFRVIHAIF